MKGTFVAHRVSVWRLNGINKVPEELDNTVVAALHNPTTLGRITSNPERVFGSIDRLTAMANACLDFMLRGEPDANAIEGKIDSATNEIRCQRISNQKPGVFITVEAEQSVEDFAPGTLIERDTYAYFVTNIANTPWKNDLRFQEQTVLAAVAASLPPNVAAEAILESRKNWIIHQRTGKPVLGFQAKGRPVRMFLAAPMTPEQPHFAKSYANVIADNEAIRGALNLFMLAAEIANNDEVERFIVSWAALETLVKALFKSVYEARSAEIDSSQFEGSLKEALDKLHWNKVPLRAQFAAIGAIANPGGIPKVFEAFSKLYHIRNDLFHEAKSPNGFPIDETNRQFVDLLRFHLEGQE